jgi:hypothetical protein
LMDMLHHPSPVIRANAFEGLVTAARHDRMVLDKIITASSDPMNRSRLMGTISVAQVAVGCLLRVGNSESTEAAQALLRAWPDADRADLVWYLRSEGLQIG